MEKIKIAIGAPTYNSSERIQRLLTSIELNTDYDRSSFRIVVLDDGTPDLDMRKRLKEVCDRFGVDFIQHEKNEGIPKSWNDLSNHFENDYVVLFNDDVVVEDSRWLTCAMYALENNDKVATVGFPLIQINPATKQVDSNYMLPDYNSPPGRVGAPIGCAFVFKKRYFLEVDCVDERYTSFYEEIDLGFEFAKRGYYSVMLSFPAVQHWGSLTFARNIELSLTQIKDELCSMQEYKQIMAKKFPTERIEPVPGFVYRMDYSRVLFAKKWGCNDFWDCPQNVVHAKYVDPLEKINFKYLDKDMQECEMLI